MTNDDFVSQKVESILMIQNTPNRQKALKPVAIVSPIKSPGVAKFKADANISMKILLVLNPSALSIPNS